MGTTLILFQSNPPAAVCHLATKDGTHKGLGTLKIRNMEIWAPEMHIMMMMMVVVVMMMMTIIVTRIWILKIGICCNEFSIAKGK